MSTAKKPAPGSVMAEPDLSQRVEVSDDDRTVATAEVTTSEGSGGTARVSLRAEPGHITPGRRASLVDAVLDLPEVQESARVEAAFRLGDSESLHRLQERCEDVSTRPAGWSALVDANLPSRRAGQHVPTRRQKPPAGRITIACSPCGRRRPSWPMASYRCVPVGRDARLRMMPDRFASGRCAPASAGPAGLSCASAGQARVSVGVRGEPASPERGRARRPRFAGACRAWRRDGSCGF